MVMATIFIIREVEKVWAFFIETGNWAKWHDGSVIVRVSPRWQEGATIVWSMGPTSTIRSLVIGKVIEIESPYITEKYTFTPWKVGETLVEGDFAACNGAFFSDRGLAFQTKMQSELRCLKQCVENEIL